MIAILPRIGMHDADRMFLSPCTHAPHPRILPLGPTSTSSTKHYLLLCHSQVKESGRNHPQTNQSIALPILPLPADINSILLDNGYRGRFTEKQRPVDTNNCMHGNSSAPGLSRTLQGPVLKHDLRSVTKETHAKAYTMQRERCPCTLPGLVGTPTSGLPAYAPLPQSASEVYHRCIRYMSKYVCLYT